MKIICKRQFLILIFWMPFLVIGQSGDGIQFERESNWEQVKAKASASGKYIFLDCFASWCGPCKRMDQEIFSSTKLGDYFKDHFIAVRVQMDTSKGDNEEVKKWYGDAKLIMNKFKINAFPGFLFFSPNGMPVHRGVGYMGIDQFLSLAEEAISPEGQYYTLLKSYQKGVMDYIRMPYLARASKSFAENRLANTIARDYLGNLSNEDLFRKENLQFLREFTNSSSDIGFEILWKYPGKVDSVLGRNTSERKLLTIIGREIDTSLLCMKEGSERDNAEKKLMDKYDNFGKLAFIEQQFLYSWQKHDWRDFSKYYVLYYKNIGDLNRFEINNASWQIFLHSNDQRTLKFAVLTMEKYKEVDVDTRDTYANLLYKLGNTPEAIIWEQKAVELESELANKRNKTPNKVYQETLNNMKGGIPTWLKAE